MCGRIEAAKPQGCAWKVDKGQTEELKVNTKGFFYTMVASERKKNKEKNKTTH